jgi:hypothetical protein
MVPMKILVHPSWYTVGTLSFLLSYQKLSYGLREHYTGRSKEKRVMLKTP